MRKETYIKKLSGKWVKRIVEEEEIDVDIIHIEKEITYCNREIERCNNVILEMQENITELETLRESIDIV